MKKDCFVSVVAPLWNDQDVVADFARETIRILDAHYAYYELILVDDGSTDETALHVQKVLDTVPCIRLLRLSRHFGDEIAIYAGLDAVIGDYVVTMMPRTDPPGLLPQVVDELQSHEGVVIGVMPNRRESFTKRLGSRIFYSICRRFLELDIPKHSTQLRAFSRRALNALLQIKERHRYLKVFSSYIGYQHVLFPYEAVTRQNHAPRERGLLRSIELAVNVVVADSTRLLRLVTGVGLLASMLNLLYMGYIVAIAIFKSDVAEGWITLSAQNAGMFFFLFIILTVLGEYIGRILSETQHRPLYYLMEERNSSVPVTNPDRLNVLTESRPHAR